MDPEASLRFVLPFRLKVDDHSVRRILHADPKFADSASAAALKQKPNHNILYFMYLNHLMYNNFDGSNFKMTKTLSNLKKILVTSENVKFSIIQFRALKFWISLWRFCSTFVCCLVIIWRNCARREVPSMTSAQCFKTSSKSGVGAIVDADSALAR